MARRSCLALFLLSAPALLAGCGTTRFTDTARTATEMLLMSKAVDDALADIDFRPLAGKTVFLEEKYLDGIQDKGYLVSALRQQLLASGALLQEEKTKATYVVEPRAGALATDRTGVLVGVPATPLPTFSAPVPVPYPNMLPEIPFAKNTEQKAYAKIAVFAYNRLTGRPVLQSGVVQGAANAEDMWVLGLGPFQTGSIRPKAEFIGTPVPFFGGSGEEPPAYAQINATQPATWTEPVGGTVANRDVKPPDVPKPAGAAPAGPPAPPASGFAADRTPEKLPSSLEPSVLPASFLPK